MSVKKLLKKAFLKTKTTTKSQHKKRVFGAGVNHEVIELGVPGALN